MAKPASSIGYNSCEAYFITVGVLCSDVRFFTHNRAQLDHVPGQISALLAVGLASEAALQGVTPLASVVYPRATRQYFRRFAETLVRKCLR